MHVAIPDQIQFNLCVCLLLCWKEWQHNSPEVQRKIDDMFRCLLTHILCFHDAITSSSWRWLFIIHRGSSTIQGNIHKPEKIVEIFFFSRVVFVAVINAVIPPLWPADENGLSLPCDSSSLWISICALSHHQINSSSPESSQGCCGTFVQIRCVIAFAYYRYFFQNKNYWNVNWTRGTGRGGPPGQACKYSHFAK